jgi:RNA polymerase sigma factor FliA
MRPRQPGSTRPASTRCQVTALVEDHVSLVDHLVSERMAKVPPHVSRDELTSAAMMALVLAARSFDPERGVPFAHFASIRIRGAMTDELRGMDWATRSVRSRAREVDSARNQLTVVLDRTPQSTEVAQALQVSTRELAILQADIARASVLSLQDLAPGAAGELSAELSDGPESLIVQREQLGYLHDAIAELPDRLRRVISAYFFEQRQMRDIGAEFGVTQARASQLCTEALRMLRDGMNSQLDPAAVRTSIQSKKTAAVRRAYFDAIATRSSLRDRLSKSTALGEVVGELATVEEAERSLIA